MKVFFIAFPPFPKLFLWTALASLTLGSLTNCSYLLADQETRVQVAEIRQQTKREMAGDPSLSQREAMRKAIVTLRLNNDFRLRNDQLRSRLKNPRAIPSTSEDAGIFAAVSSTVSAPDTSLAAGVDGNLRLLSASSDVEQLKSASQTTQKSAPSVPLEDFKGIYKSDDGECLVYFEYGVHSTNWLFARPYLREYVLLKNRAGKLEEFYETYDHISGNFFRNLYGRTHEFSHDLSRVNSVYPAQKRRLLLRQSSDIPSVMHRMFVARADRNADIAMGIGAGILAGGILATKAAGDFATDALASVGPIPSDPSRSGIAGSSEMPASASTAELQRFATTFSGGYHNFTCTRDTNAGQSNMSPWLTLRASNGKEWAIQYSVPMFLSGNKGKTGGLATDDRQNLEGVTMNVNFNSAGEPVSIKNMSNGNHCEVKDWKVTGYGW